MRPTPAETIAGIRRILRDVVEPEVGSEYARQRLREVRAVLAQIDWDDAALRLRRRDQALRGLLADARTWIEADPARRRAFADLLPQLAGPGEPVPEELAALNAVHARHAAVLTEVAGRLATWLRAHPEDAGGRELRLRMMRHLAV
ncbi:hypothetical protein Acsp04_61890 [Actinomadura sp. NBRC 104425]|uniref:hypothetical protein n=1 Tax=Actinomadura sp. NBRC 104425 TaxID=3032204 RepID=UPI0024A0F2D7|nr:hypothetical protein [Actinomadura sp. NBRC 104425]GLZ15954.1 hypothetical protein Acsp04_61890 [Actinomadura sp. NBRC 104425]